ncbi:MAG: methyltransferase domain-containing protein [Actinomycetota bacterium]|nr:methyltransferase domain-containing protein [Actinomycetota bacterium]
MSSDGDSDLLPSGLAPAQWTVVDQGWGRRAVDFAALSEPANCREYVALHQLLGIGPRDRVLDVACGSGLAVELCAARGATVAGLDASQRLIAVARDRSPQADLQVGDMHALPWADNTFDVVTSFRGIWGTTPAAVAQARRVLRPGGRMGLTVWGHIKASPGAWALAPFTLAAPDKVANQSAMVRLGRPGAGEDLLTSLGFQDVERHEIPFAWEFADPDHDARALASTGPAYEAIQVVGEEAFLANARQIASERLRDGLPLRAVILVVGYIATKPLDTPPDHDDESSGTFLAAAPASAAAARLRQDDLDEVGYIMNVSRLWGHMPAALDGLFGLLGQCVKQGRLDMRTRGILVAATASTLGDSYCSLAWGGKLTKAADSGLAARVLVGDDSGLDAHEQALAAWARTITRDPNSTTAADVTALREAGLDDGQIMAVTIFVALRVAFSTVNDALGAVPDPELVAGLPSAITDVVTWGRH